MPTKTAYDAVLALVTKRKWNVVDSRAPTLVRRDGLIERSRIGQRHVRNAVDAGSELRFINYRETTPLRGGQVDDAPYGGGAGMVLRVDVVDAALRAAYEPTGASPRVIVLAERA